ncbi:MAG: ATP-dependent RecD-like DNA helicase, partial [Clostridiales bacterium]|nr:ATP-dependent RecD-like DNA helicase [Clostridiales bacterium]
MKSNLEVLEGKIESVIYAGIDGDFSVFAVIVEGNGQKDEVICTVADAVNIGEDVKLYGSFVIHPTYGRQFKAMAVEKLLPRTESGMEKFLASGVIRGVGKKRAKAIIDAFGLNAFDILENSPAKLAQIRGISPQKALEMGQDFKQTAAQRNTIMYLQSLGLTAGQCHKIYERYGAEAIDKIKENPYILAKDIFGIGFKTADIIALRAGMPHNSPHRISAGLTHVLLEAASGEGHVYLPKEALLARSAALLGLAKGDIDNHLLQMQMDG